MTLEISPRGLVSLAAHEGVALNTYPDIKGVLTIGVGHTSMAGPPDPALVTEEITIERALEIFDKDLDKYEKEVRDVVNVPLTQNQFDALVSFHFNTGGISKAMLTKALNEGDYELAGRRFMGWLKPAAIRGRREDEQRLFMKGVYPNAPVSVWRYDGSRLRRVGQISAPILLEKLNAVSAARSGAPERKGLFEALLDTLLDLVR